MPARKNVYEFILYFQDFLSLIELLKRCQWSFFVVSLFISSLESFSFSVKFSVCLSFSCAAIL